LSDFIAQIPNERLRRLYLYWQDKRQGREFPARRDIDPAEFLFVLGNVILLDVTYEPMQFRFRLMGSNIVARIGYDMTGRSIDDIPDADRRNYAQKLYRGVVEGRQPQTSRRDRIIDGWRWTSEILALPLSSYGGIIDMLLVANVFVENR
jgi:hypothetical protein